MSLLDKAKATKSRVMRRCPPAEELELAIAFFRGEVSGPQVSMALSNDPKANCGQASMAKALRNACIAGLVTIKVSR